MRLDRMASPLGKLLLVTDAEGCLLAVDFHDYEARLRALLRRFHGSDTTADGVAPAGVRDALAAYFAGRLDALAEIPWRAGGTAFQRLVWAALTAIPPGATQTYAGLACAIGRPSAVRAVGAANGANPLSIVVPCHRLIGADGGLTGYGGGLHRKAWLLRHEGARL